MSITSPAPAPAASEAPAPTPAPAATPPAAPEYKAPASQDELDRIIEGRLARERDKFKDYDAIKQKAADHDAYVESQKTEAQKAIDAARGEATTETTQKFLTKLVGSEVKSIASALGFNDPSDALQVLGAELPVKDGEPDADAIKALVEKLATDKPYLLTAGKVTPKPRTRPTVPKGDPAESAGEPGKGRAAAALRMLNTSRRND